MKKLNIFRAIRNLQNRKRYSRNFHPKVNEEWEKDTVSEKTESILINTTLPLEERLREIKERLDRFNEQLPNLNELK